MRRCLPFLYALPPFALLFALLWWPQAAAAGAQAGLRLFAGQVLPTLLPFLVGVNLLLAAGTFQRENRLGRWLGAPFGLGAAGGWALPFCLLTGAPTSARIVGAMREAGALTHAQARALCATATGTGPAFLIGVVGSWLGAPGLGAFLWVVQTVAGLWNGLLWHWFAKKDTEVSASARPYAPPLSPFQALPEAVYGASVACLVAAGAMCLFPALDGVLRETGLVTALACFFGDALPEKAAQAAVSGTLELCTGARLAVEAALPFPDTMALLCALASFGGLSILLQSTGLMRGAVALWPLLAQRISHAALAFVLARIASVWLRPNLPVVAGFSATAATFPTTLPLAALALCLALGVGGKWLARQIMLKHN